MGMLWEWEKTVSYPLWMPLLLFLSFLPLDSIVEQDIVSIWNAIIWNVITECPSGWHYWCQWAESMAGERQHCKCGGGSLPFPPISGQILVLLYTFWFCLAVWTTPLKGLKYMTLGNIPKVNSISSLLRHEYICLMERCELNGLSCTWNMHKGTWGKIIWTKPWEGKPGRWMQGWFCPCWCSPMPTPSSPSGRGGWWVTTINYPRLGRHNTCSQTHSFVAMNPVLSCLLRPRLTFYSLV